MILATLLLPIALAQEPVPPPGAPAPGVIPAMPTEGPEVALPAPLDLSAVLQPPPVDLPRSRTSVWNAVGPLGEQRFVDIALHPQAPGIWVAVQEDGTVWVTVDAGDSWFEVLEGDGTRFGSTSRDEDLILDVQARIDELSDRMGEAATDEEAEDLTNEAAAAAQDVALGVQGEIEQGLWFDDRGGSVLARVGRVRVSFTASGVLMVSRPDGLHVSPDLGATWIPVLDSPVSHAVETEAGEILAVGPVGAWTSTDLITWTSTTLPLSSAPTDLVVDGGLWVSSPDGLWLRRDGVWQPLPTGPEPLTARPADPTPYPALVVGTPEDIFRAAPYDQEVAPVLGGPMPSVHDIERAPDGSLIAASAAGPFESRDQGRTWQGFSDGLDDPTVEAVAIRGAEILLVGTSGVWRLDPRAEVVPERPQRPAELPPFASLNDLIYTSTTRRELRQRIGRRAVAALFPELQLEYYQVHDEGPTWYNNDPGGTLYSIDGYWRAQIRLTWRPNRQRTSTSFNVETADDMSVVVVGDDVVVAGEEAPLILYSKVSRGAAAYRSVLVNQITELYRLRARLLLEAPPQDVRKAVLRQLNLAEVDAKLDVLTEGAVSAYLAGAALAEAPGGAP